MNFLTLVNTEAGRYLLSTLGKKPRYPIVKVTENSFIEHIEGDIYQATFYSRSPIYELFLPTLEKMHISNEEYKPIDDYYEAFLHFSGLELSKRYPFIFLDQNTYNPATGAASPVDGYVGREIGGAGESFASIQSSAGTTFNNINASDSYKLFASSTINQYNNLYRYIGGFGTSTLTSAAAITAATLGFYINSKSNGIGSPDLHVASASPASASTLANGDYGNTGSTSFGSVAYASANTSAFNDITLNSNGLAAINKTSNTFFSAKVSWDINASFTGAWSSGADSGFNFDNADGSNKPRLIVTFTIVQGALWFM